MLLTISILIFLLGLGLFMIGLRGRRMNDHPYCRKCGFDLSGHEADVARCPECDADLSSEGSVRLGRRARRKGLMAGGVAVFVLAIFVFSLTGLDAGAWNSMKPTWLLIQELKTANEKAITLSVAELEKRLNKKWLRQDQLDSLAAAALVRQADQKRDWPAALGDLLATVHLNGQMSKAHREKYLKQIAKLELNIRRRIDVSGKMAIETIGRIRASDNEGLWLFTGVTEIVYKGKKYPVKSGASGSGLSANGTSSGTTSLYLKEHAKLELPPGKHTLELGVTCDIRDQNRAILSQWIERYSFEIEVVPASEELITMTKDASLHAAVVSSLACRNITANTQIGGTINVSEPPVGLAFRVLVDDGESDPWEMGTFYMAAGKDSNWHVGRFKKPLPKIAGKTVNLILVPDKEVAISSIDIEEIYGEKVVLEDVPVWR